MRPLRSSTPVRLAVACTLSAALVPLAVWPQLSARLTGETYDLAGSERLSVRDLATIAGEVLGRAVDAVEIPLQEWMTGSGADLPQQARDDLAAMFRSYDREGLVGDSRRVRTLLGREPRGWRDVLA